MNATELKKHLEIIRTLIESGDDQHITTELTIDNHLFEYRISYNQESASYEARVNYREGCSGYSETVLELDLMPWPPGQSPKS